ncbi:MAG: septum formation inhibitor Maf [gamma proteobacterium endosymbiont of Lamellibrachia anaximandri]|nr:septum formation inhibitor Maf [gamma proteobacterium endosymbiont of Lamellibrachia anaximandri]MBL3617280.1 septum formation inhibitor Maf [gamma proteobacterium endosymbiont of Lamellibrachia anaximandri]
MRTLVLGSTSPFRRELLNRLGIAFETASPEIDESPVPGEAPEALVTRLARLKAEAVRESWPDALIIGSDQVATIDGEILGKPGSHERAVEQLSKAAGKRVTFSTGLCLLNSRTGNTQICCEPFHVYFRQLGQQAIEHYLQREQPYNCAGSFKSEGLGITLFEKMEGDDPNSLIGLPLIRLVDMLANEGWDILGNA